mmetsp:Transcript_114728/g.225090  ORF Transcript_114728/g.225090 Transcript_114728/m.225090 type:complete len:163 (+) Transcript_114728:166-654(+)
MDTAKLTSAPKMEAMAMAKGLVMFRDNKDNRKDGLATCKNRTAAAVPNKPPRELTPTPVITSLRLSFINFRRSYMLIAKETTAGPNKNNNTSPAPDWIPNRPTRYCWSMDLKVDPVSMAQAVAMLHVIVVHVTRGWTTLVKALGSRAPKQKLCKVANKKKKD